MAVYSIPKKDPYVIRVKKGETVSDTLKETTTRRKNIMRDSAERFENKNINKGW